MSDTDDFQSSSLNNPRIRRRSYLVTYAQADLSKFPTRESFGLMLEKHFNYTYAKVLSKTKTKVLFWACCMEEHTTKGVHYHCSLKLSHSKKWKKVKEGIQNNEGIAVHFSSTHSQYIAAYRYVCKEDHNVFHSSNHPHLETIGTGRTEKASCAYKESHKQKSSNEMSQTAKRPKRLSNLDVSNFLVENDIRSSTKLFAFAKERKTEGEADLATFLY